jgi:hypothetical protein
MNEPRHIYRCTFGSRLYGTALAGSDFDTKGIFLPSRDDLLLCEPPRTWSAPPQPGCDNESYSLQRYLELLSQGQTVALDMLFAPAAEWKLMDPVWYDVMQLAPRAILNKRCGAAIGYARAQAERYSLRGARIKALEHALDVLRVFFPSNPVFMALPNILAEPNSYIKADMEHLEVCGKKVDLTSSVERARTLFTKMKDEYGDRANQAAAGGADWKALYHAVRITEQTIELLQTGRITFPRENAADLLAIRRGEYSPETIYERIESGIADIERAQAESELPDEPDLDAINQLVRKVHLEIINEH